MHDCYRLLANEARGQGGEVLTLSKSYVHSYNWWISQVFDNNNWFIA